MLVCCCIGVWRFRVVVDLRVVWWSQLLSVDIISPLWSTALKRSNPLMEPEEVPAHLMKPEVPAPLRSSEVTPSRTQPDVIDLTGED